MIESIYKEKMKRRKSAGKTELKGEIDAIVEDGDSKGSVKNLSSQERSQELENVGNLETSPVRLNFFSGI